MLLILIEVSTSGNTHFSNLGETESGKSRGGRVSAEGGVLGRRKLEEGVLRRKRLE